MDCAGNELIQDGRGFGVELIDHEPNRTRFSSASARAQSSGKGEEIEDYTQSRSIRFTTIGLMIGVWSMESGDW